ncbi:MAG: ATP-binding protein [Anaerolineales bacterium]
MRSLPPPVFPNDPEKTHLAFVLNVLLLTLGGIVSLGGGLGYFFIFEEKVFTAIISLLGIAIIVLGWLLLKRGLVQQTSTLVLVTYWIVVTTRMFLGGGIVSYDLMFHISGTILVGLLSGTGGIALYVVMTLLAIISMTIAQAMGITLPGIFTYPPGSILILFLINIGFAVVPVLVTLDYLAKTIKRANADLEERTAVEQVISQRAAEMEMLYRIGMAFSKSRDLQSLLENIYTHVSAIFPINTFYIAIYDESTNQVSFPLFMNNGTPVTLAPRTVSKKAGLTGHIIKNRSLLYLPDINDPQVQQQYDIIILAPSITASFLGIPLLSEGRIIGVMSVQSSQPNAYTAEQIRLFETISIQVASAVERALLVDQLQKELDERQKAEASLREERDTLRYRQMMIEKVLEMGKIIAQETDLNACLRLAHQSIQKGLGFDRVGLFLYDAAAEIIQGTYGTDRQGKMTDNTHVRETVAPHSAWRVSLNDPMGVSVVENYQELHQHGPESEMYGVREHVTLAAWAGGKPLALIAVDNVITQRNILPEQLEALRLLAGYIGLSIRNAQLNAELEQRVRERTAQLEGAIAELESFSYSVAHDLRAPLRGMRGFSQIILEEEGENLTEDAREKLQRIRTSAQTMGELIDALLDFSRLTRAELNRKQVDLGKIASNHLLAMAQETPQRSVEIQIENNLVTHADESLVRILLNNLLDNAWKFTSQTPQAKITFGKQVMNGETVFFIRDNGAGFNMEYAGKLFGAFQRLHRPDEFPGHGAGLAVAQRIVQKHGGRIWAQGQPGQGATFFFTLG